MAKRLPNRPIGTGIAVAIAMIVGALPVVAAEGGIIPGYAVDSAGVVVKSLDGSCVRTSDWKEEFVLEECDPELYARLHPKPEPVAVEEEVEVAAIVPASVAVKETLDVQTLFGFDQATLDPQSTEQLDELADRLGRFTSIESVRITGYTDRIGSKAYNLALSKKRAEAVEAHFREKTDLPASKFAVEGLGAADPIEACEQVRGAALIECLGPNRRVEVEIRAVRTDTTPATH